MSKLIPIALLSFFIICPAMGAIITPILSNCGTKTCKKELAQYCSISYDYNGQPNLQNSSCKNCNESLGWGTGDNYSEPDNATYITWTQEASDGEMTNPYAQADGCTWHATCPAGTYLQRTHTTDSKGYTYDHTTCSPCSDLGASYINKSNDTYDITYSLTRSDTGNIKITTTCNNIGDCPVDNFGNQYTYPTTLTDDNKYIFNRICSQCAENQLVNSTEDGCTTCPEGTLVDEKREKCVCRKDGYFVSGTSCLSCGDDNATSYKYDPTNEYSNNAGCQCKDTNKHYNLKGFYINNNKTAYNNQAQKTANCQLRPIITYKVTRYDDQVYQFTDNNANPEIQADGYPTVSASEAITPLQNFTGYILSTWQLPKYKVSSDSLRCAKIGTIEYTPSESISQTDYLNTMLCNKNSDNKPEFILTAKTKPKNVHYHYYTTDSTEHSTCQKDTQLCNENGDSAKCPASEIKCDSSIPDGYYVDNTNTTWTLINENGQFINNTGNVVNTATVNYTPDTHISYPATDVYLLTQLTKCPVDYYCSGGKMINCPRGTSTNKETGKSSPEDCVIDNGWKICAGDYCFGLTGGLKKFTK